MKRIVKDFKREGGSCSTLYYCLVDGTETYFLRREDVLYIDEVARIIDGYRWYLLDMSIDKVSRRNREAEEVDADFSFELELQADRLKDENDALQYRKTLDRSIAYRQRKALLYRGDGDYQHFV